MVQNKVKDDENKVESNNNNKSIGEFELNQSVINLTRLLRECDILSLESIYLGH